MSFEWLPATFDLNRIQLIMSGDFIVKPGWVYGPVHHGHRQIVYFPEGSETRYMSPSKSIILNKPCIIMTPSNESYAYEFDKTRPVRHMFVTYQWDLPDRVTQEESTFVQSIEDTFVPHLIKQMLYLSNKKVYKWEERCKLLLLSAMAELEGLAGLPSAKSPQITDTKHSQPVWKAIDYIDRHLSEPITVAQLADEVGWSHEHFTRKFVQYTGMSPQQAILMRRIERACQLLVQGDRNISEIAYSTGFQNAHYFSRTFKRMKGMTASVYRQNYALPNLKHISPVNELEASYPLNHYFYYTLGDERG